MTGRPAREPEQFSGYPVAIDVDVAWGEMDAFGHVNNMFYLRYFENARIVWFDRVGIALDPQRHGVGPIIARADVTFRRPLTHPDRLRVEVGCVRLGGSSLTLHHRVWSRSQAGDDGAPVLAAEGEAVVVLLDYEAGRSVTVDEPTRARIRALQDPAG